MGSNVRDSATEMKAFEDHCESTIQFFRSELGKAKTGRANSGILEGVMVDYYGSPTPLQSLGMVAVAEARMLTVQVYDISAVENVEKAIRQADLGLNPAREGGLIRVPIPALTEDRRKEIVKRLHKNAEEMKVAIRNHRRTTLDHLALLKKDGELSEDALNGLKKTVQTVTDKFVARIDEMLKAKEAEVMEV
ncbi:MAG: ribosome recycling factor [Bdellovibrionales bacterium]|nr:ribosome recycling factor [Bdellovibrionales bacterium]